MELLKLDERPAEFPWNDITILYRRNVSCEDKYSVDTAGVAKKDEAEFSPWEFYKAMIRVFVVGWTNVNEDGKPVPYSYDTMMKRLPGNNQDDLIMKLGLKIAYDTGFLIEKKDDGSAEIKNG